MEAGYRIDNYDGLASDDTNVIMVKNYDTLNEVHNIPLHTREIEEYISHCTVAVFHIHPKKTS